MHMFLFLFEKWNSTLDKNCVHCINLCTFLASLDCKNIVFDNKKKFNIRIKYLARSLLFV